MKDEIKDYVFAALPDGSGKWIVVAWGKIINAQTGSYEQEIVLKRYSERDDPSTIWNLRDFRELAFCKIDLGSVRVLSPGTIVQNQKIIMFPHEYLIKRTITIDNPSALLKRPFRILYAPTFPGWERHDLISSVDKVETRLLTGSGLNVLFPCDVIADYYYYGKTYMVKAVMEGKISHRFINGNDLYNPRTLVREVSPSGQVLVRVELQRKMSFKDEFKIARLAFDDYFRSKCLDIHTGILRGNVQESYIDTDFPVQGPVTLSVYGVETNNLRENFFLVLSISKCTAKAPFDLAVVGKKFNGKTYFKSIGGGNGDQGDSEDKWLGVALKGPGGKRRSKTILDKGGHNIIGGEKPYWNAGAKEFVYDRDQVDNLSQGAMINEKDFIDPAKRAELEETLRRFGFAAGLSTDPNKRGSALVLQLGLLGIGPTKPKPAPPTTAFQIIENLTQLTEQSLIGRLHQVSSTIRCPVVEGIDKYSAFPVKELTAELKQQKNIEWTRHCINFCFKNIREHRHTHHRRVYINELIVDGRVFYIMDVEPKYKVENEKKEVERLVASLGVIFHAKSMLDDTQLKAILKQIVYTKRNSVLGRWRFLSAMKGFEFLCIQHRVDSRSFNGVVEFILRRCDRK
ncbi:MAG: hypothetical protein JSS93_04025 [Bacteroidetes bacterium]|nr:hypothetical protein [Bacteroidota bacterium]